MVRHRAHNPKIGGSIPPPARNAYNFLLRFIILTDKVTNMKGGEKYAI